jgi:hypothetical protein
VSSLRAEASTRTATTRNRVIPSVLIFIRGHFYLHS